MCNVTPDSSCELPSSLHAPSLARGFVQSTLCREHAESAEPAVTLLTDELVTQAVLYGAPPVALTLRCGVIEVTIEVTDSAPEYAEPQKPSHELSMLLVDKVSHSWGSEPSDGGKLVWCKLPSGALPPMRTYEPRPSPARMPHRVTAGAHVDETGRALPFDTTSES